MKKLKLILPIALVVLLVAASGLFYLYPFPFGERAPFTDLRFKDGRVFVEIEDREYEWLSAEGESIEEIQRFAKTTFADLWQDQIGGGFILLMKEMGHWVLFSTDLQLKDEQGNVVSKTVEVSKSNVNRIYWKKSQAKRVRRAHSVQIPDSLKYLAQRIDGYNPSENVEQVKKGNQWWYNGDLPPNSWVPKELAVIDLEKMEYNLTKSYAYADLKGVNYPLAIDAIIADLGKGISRRDLGTQVKRLLALFGDGHCSLSRRELKLDSLYLPFKVKKIDGRYIAALSNKLYQKEYPEMVSIDGVSMSSLQQKAGEMAFKGSLQYYERVSLFYLSSYGFLKKLLRIENTVPNIQWTNGQDTITTEVPLITGKEREQMFPAKESHHKLLEHNIGYIYLHKMEGDKSYISWLYQAMGEFENTEALIIDIRGNGGGRRNPTYALLPYFIASPRVINVNALRIDKGLDPDIDEPVGELELRMAYPEKSAHWTAKERQAIADFKTTFIPEWKLDPNKFSKWHYSVVSPNENHYDKPVYVLMDNGNFSASDIFLGAFKGCGEKVRLVGQRSGGGSGFMRGFSIKSLGSGYRLPRMASFQPNGKLYEGNGVIPDIEIKETIEGIQKDEVLEAVLGMIGS